MHKPGFGATKIIAALAKEGIHIRGSDSTVNAVLYRKTWQHVR